MALFQTLKTTVPDEVIQSFKIVWQSLGEPGRGGQVTKVEIANEVRNSERPALDERTNDLSQYSHEETESISPYVKAVIRKITYESSTIDRDAYDSIVEVLGEDRYAELAAIVTQVVPIFTLADILDCPREELPTAQDGSTTQERPDDLVDDVAFLQPFHPKACRMSQFH
ncbi:MAG: hypothetical protein CM15mP49_06910 [Actinomycetota bacterium]|nr:MAG: hypothetical protein CM15mP49_06910 [Actinomycetota bacterium]